MFESYQMKEIEMGRICTHLGNKISYKILFKTQLARCRRSWDKENKVNLKKFEDVI
jgi:hypothetical protein